MREDDDLMSELADRPRKKKKKGISMFTVIGVLLMLGGLGALGYVGFEYFGTNVVAQKAIDEERSTLRTQWQAEPAPKAEAPDKPAKPKERVPGNAIALLRIPRLGADYEVPIVSGTDAKSLAKGVGWYETSVHAGQIGNFSLAGHRVTHGEPFRDVLKLKKGDEVIVETREAVFTYVMDTSPADLTVQDTDTWVLDPVPGKPNEQPTQALITITTCQDFFHSADRSIGFGHLASTKAK